MSTPRWTFSSKTNLADKYDFAINPNAHASLIPVRQHDWFTGQDGVSGRRAGRTPHPTSFSGVVRSQEQFQTFVQWLNRRQRIWLTTDLGQRLDVRLMAFRPEAQKMRIQAPWRHTYTMDILVFSSETIIAASSMPGWVAGNPWSYGPGPGPAGQGGLPGNSYVANVGFNNSDMNNVIDFHMLSSPVYDDTVWGAHAVFYGFDGSVIEEYDIDGYATHPTGTARPEWHRRVQFPSYPDPESGPNQGRPIYNRIGAFKVTFRTGAFVGTRPGTSFTMTMEGPA